MANFYLKVLKIYDDKQVPEKIMRQSLDMIFKDFVESSPKDYQREHVTLMKEVIQRFSDQEEFEKAALIKEAYKATISLLEKKENKDDTETDTKA